MTRKNLRNTGLAALALITTAGAPGEEAPANAAATNGDAQALLTALDDEYRAEAIYAAVIDIHGDARPFINIIEAERHHAAMAKAEMDRLGVSYPEVNPYFGTLEVPATLLGACEQGVTAEIENIALYDRFLPAIEDDQVRETLSKLQWASRERHLPAFERCVARGGTMGQGGMGFGRGSH